MYAVVGFFVVKPVRPPPVERKAGKVKFDVHFGHKGTAYNRQCRKSKQPAVDSAYVHTYVEVLAAARPRFNVSVVVV